MNGYLHKVRLVFTGGTISMTVDPATGAAVPALSGGQILEAAPELLSLADIEVEDYARIPGPHMTPERMFDLSSRIRELLDREDLAGVVVTHGTDTLEETAFLLDLTIDHQKPVVLTGAMRTSSEVGWDGPSNLADAIATVLSWEARGQGVLVVSAGEIHAAAEVTKVHTSDPAAFGSPGFGPLGMVDGGRVLFFRKATRRGFMPASAIEPRVDLIKAAAGMDDRFINCSLETGARGIVVEGLGRGNLPPKMAQGVARAVAAGVPVVVVSRCPEGRVLDCYGYDGAGRQLREAGAIFGGYLSGPKARIKLMVALGATQDVGKIRALFEEDLY